MSTVEHWSPEKEPKALPVTLTDKALQHVQNRLQQRGSGIGLRLAVEASGCNGYKCVVDFVDTAEADDHIFPVQADIAVYVNKDSLAFVAGTEIDYVREGLNEHFVFHNPQQAGECGCGESFSIDTDE